MEKIKSLYAIDSHTMGEPTRIILEGLPPIDGCSMMEKKTCLVKSYDYIRRAAMNEPRGHRDMFGAALFPSQRPDADMGVVFMDSGGYLNMCGHGTIGAATVAVEEGLVKVSEPYTFITLEAPAGLVHTRVKVQNGKAMEVSFINVPSFLYHKDLIVELSGLGKIKVDIAFGGNFFALADAQALGLELVPENLSEILSHGNQIREAVNSQIKVSHPLLKNICSVDLVEFYSPAKTPGATLRNTVFFGRDQIDRSPCGTGTSAKMASLFARGSLKLHEDFISESILGTQFRGRGVEETQIGPFKAIIPEITGRAFITGKNTLLFEDEDPFQFGFAI